VDYRRVCRLLRQWRENAGLSQRDLAKRICKPHSFVYKCEVGNRRLDVTEFIAWCRACELEPSALIKVVEMP
jgi:predicted transcriptional regulator